MEDIIITKERQFPDYGKGEFLGGSEDMAHNKFDAYKVGDEMHLVFESGHVASEKIQKVRDNLDYYLWTPYVIFVQEAMQRQIATSNCKSL